MASQSETPSLLTRDQILSLISRHLDGPQPLTVRRCRATGVGYLIGSVFLLAIASFLLWNFRGYSLLIGGGIGIYGGTLLLYGLVYLVDRTPQLILDENGLADHTTGVKRLYPWDAIARANLSRTTRNGSETSATLTLHLNSPILRDKEVIISVGDLDCSSGEIFRAVGRWAKLN